jgi:hypothetical protein
MKVFFALLGATTFVLATPPAMATHPVSQPAELCAFRQAVTIYGEIYTARQDGTAWYIPCSHVKWETNA